MTTSTRILTLLLCAFLQACIAFPSNPDLYEFLSVKNQRGDTVTGTHIQPMKRYLTSPDGPRRVQAGDRTSHYLWIGADGTQRNLDFLTPPRLWPERNLWLIHPVQNSNQWIAYRMIPVVTSLVSLSPYKPRQEYELLLFDKQQVIHSLKLTADLLPRHAWLRGNDTRKATTIENHYINIANQHLHFIDTGKDYEIIVRDDRLTTQPSITAK